MSRTKLPAQRCPICKTRHPVEALRCDQCGATLNGTPLPDDLIALPSAKRRTQINPKLVRMEGPTAADWDSGEADLFEEYMPAMRFPALLVSVIALAAVIGLGIFIVTRSGAAGGAPDPTAAFNLTVVVQNLDDQNSNSPGAAVTRRAPPPTNTRVMLVPTAAVPSVTPQPPTATITPTRGPCIQQARQGDTLYGLATRCGHADLAVVNVILKLNNMGSAAELQIGQRVEIPWPTPTGGPGEAVVSGEQIGQQPEQANLEATLPPGIMWHTIKKGETALSVVFDYGITMRILQELNREIRFEGCDFGEVGGGGSCNVMVYEGQRVRVPAPTPTPTLRPTLSGSETPTPTPTPTINAPIAQSPSSNMLFESFELPTLRWVATGQLALNETYLVTVVDQTANQTYNATTRELSFQLPSEWQPTDGKRHTFAWTITLATVRDGNAVYPSTITTETRTFTWQSR